MTNYESTYEDVVTSHAPECKCRPVECPNSCGASDLQYQHTEEHVSSQCPLTPVECEFSDAGCDAKVHRRDLPSHLSDNMVTHMSLLARENRKLKQQLKTQEQQLKTQEQHLDIQEQQLKYCASLKQDLVTQKERQAKQLQEEKNSLTKYAQQFSHLPPLYLICKATVLEVSKSEAFYSHAGGYKLQIESIIHNSLQGEQLMVKFRLLESEFAVQLPCRLQIISKLMNHARDAGHITMKSTVDSGRDSEFVGVGEESNHFLSKFIVNGKYKVKVKNVLVL